MKILIVGSGLMGPAAAYNAMSDPDVSQVTLYDMNQEQLDAAMAKLAGLKGSEKLTTVALSLTDQEATTKVMKEFDAVVTALPKSVDHLAIQAAAAAKTPLVSLTWPLSVREAAIARSARADGNWPPGSLMAELDEQVRAADTLVVLGCGLEPGLTEILTRYLAEKLDRVDELHIKCGGIPETPTPPLNYKIVFGGQQLPLREADAHVIEDGELTLVPRYSDAEQVFFPTVGECEAWHEGVMPWLMDLEALKDLKVGSQKTIRWPGYAEKVTALKEMGMLSNEPIEVESAQIAPKTFLDTLLRPYVTLEEGERDISLARVEVIGEKDGYPRRYKVDIVDRYNEETGMTSMGRTTAYTGTIVARMIARGDIKEKGLVMPEEVVVGPAFDILFKELAATNMQFEMTTEKTKALG